MYALGTNESPYLQAWDFVEREKPAFDLVTLCPPMVYGPPHHHVSSPTDLNESNARIYNLFINSSRDAEMPPNGLYLYVDVRVSPPFFYDLLLHLPDRNTARPGKALVAEETLQDIATAHLRAATAPEASNKRFIISQGRIGSQHISDILRQNIPELSGRTPEGAPGTSSLPANAYSADSSPAEKVLGIKFRSAEETFIDLGKELLAIEAQRS